MMRKNSQLTRNASRSSLEAAVDATRFDDFTRMLFTRDASRRALLWKLAGLTLGGVVGAGAAAGIAAKGSSHRRRRRKTRHKHNRNTVRRNKENKPNKRKPCSPACPVCQRCNRKGRCVADPGQDRAVCAGAFPSTSVCCNGVCCNGCCRVDGSCGACRVFTSSSQHNGNLGGLSGADAICQNLAAAANLPGSYMAWLSTFDDVSIIITPSTRFRRSQQPYQRVDGVVVANDWADLTDGNLANPIDKTEQNQTRVQQVWTNTLADGITVSADDCFDWTSDSLGFGRFGRSNATNLFWTTDVNEFCDNAAQGLYCFQQS
jgi:hypothetical protein